MGIIKENLVFGWENLGRLFRRRYNRKKKRLRKNIRDKKMRLRKKVQDSEKIGCYKRKFYVWLRKEKKKKERRNQGNFSDTSQDFGKADLFH